MKQKSALMYVGVLSLVVVAAFTAYFLWQRGNLNLKLEESKASYADAQKKVLDYEHNQLLETADAKDALSEIEDGLIEWSEVVYEVQRVIPDTEYGPLVEVLSYSGSGDKMISMSVQTQSESENPYFDVADLIETFDDSKDFSDIFVSSLGGVGSEEGQVFSFGFSTSYLQEKDNAEDLLDISDDGSDLIPVTR